MFLGGRGGGAVRTDLCLNNMAAFITQKKISIGTNLPPVGKRLFSGEVLRGVDGHHSSGSAMNTK